MFNPVSFYNDNFDIQKHTMGCTQKSGGNSIYEKVAKYYLKDLATQGDNFFILEVIDKDGTLIYRTYDEAAMLQFQSKISYDLHQSSQFVFETARFDTLAHFCQDFFLPITFQKVAKIQNIALRLLCAIGSAILDFMTLPIRLITLYNRACTVYKAEQHPAYDILKASVNEQLYVVVHIKKAESSSMRLVYALNLSDVSLHPNRSGEMYWYDGVLGTIRVTYANTVDELPDSVSRIESFSSEIPNESGFLTRQLREEYQNLSVTPARKESLQFIWADKRNDWERDKGIVDPFV